MDNEQLKSQIINSFFSGKPVFPTSPGTRTQEVRKETNLLCTCGQNLTEVHHRVVPVIPRHRKKRIAKKWRKRWEKENCFWVLGFGLLGAMQKPTFWCSTCKRHEGFYSAMGRNIFSVEKMPPIDPVYLK